MGMVNRRGAYAASQIWVSTTEIPREPRIVQSEYGEKVSVTFLERSLRRPRRLEHSHR